MAIVTICVHACIGMHACTVYDKTFEGENLRGFRGFGSTANVFARIFPSKFFSNNIASSSSLFLVVQIMVYKEYRNAGKEAEAPGESIV